MNKIHIKSPAKINIGLNITGKRLDGYHNLITLFYPLYDLHDELIFIKSEKDIFTFDDTIRELNNDNLVVKAKKLLEKVSNKKLNTEIILKKNIPIGAGLGGGSSDAASTLICLNELFQLKISYDQLLKLALELGSDVPFFLKSKPAIGKSRGEILIPVDFQINFPILLINPGIHISTRDVFSKLSTFSDIKSFEIQNPVNVDDIKKLNSIFKNDFEPIVFQMYPEIETIKKILNDNGALYCSMTGTGSTVFGIFENEDAALITSEKIKSNYFKHLCMPQPELM